jgi:tRNA U55 pseudouridine synthase TruB
MECSKGCYVRSIARDIAMKLGTYSYVTQLRRTKIGSFSVDNASDKIIPTIKIFDHYKQIYLDDNTAQKFINGIKTTLTDLQEVLLINHKYDLMIIVHNINGELKLKRIS